MFCVWIFFFKQKTAYEMRISDWSSDVCSSDLQELVGVAVLGVDLDLRREVGAGVLLLEHGKRRDLAVAQVALVVGPEDAAADRRLVGAAGPDALALLAHDDGGAGVLAHRQDAARRDVRVLQEVRSEEHTSELQSLMRISYA